MANGGNGRGVNNNELMRVYKEFLEKEQIYQKHIDSREDITLLQKAGEGTPELRAWKRTEIAMQKYQV